MFLQEMRFFTVAVKSGGALGYVVLAMPAEFAREAARAAIHIAVDGKFHLPIGPRVDARAVRLTHLKRGSVRDIYAVRDRKRFLFRDSLVAGSPKATSKRFQKAVRRVKRSASSLAGNMKRRAFHKNSDLFAAP